MHSEEFEERAAIREYDGKCPTDRAEQLAVTDIERRQEQDDLEGLLERRRRVIKEWQGGTDPEQNARLREEWERLSFRIIALRRESDR